METDRCCLSPRYLLSFAGASPWGTYFFDLPTAEEREQIWNMYQAKYGVQGERPNDDGWTGAEIKECCRKAYRLRLSLMDAASYTVPVSRSAAEQINPTSAVE
jgi:hypothetical protein